MTLAFMQCTKIDTHYMNIYLNKFKIENIDGAVKCPKLHHADMISNNLLSFLVESCSLQSIDVEKSFIGRSIGDIA